MEILRCLSVVALQQLVGDSARAVVDGFTKHFTDQGQALLQALRIASDRTWKALEIALAGESWWAQVKAALSNKEHQAFAGQVRDFLNAVPLPELANHIEFRKQCLLELRQARDEGLLHAGTLSAAEVAGHAKSLVAADPSAVLKAQDGALQGIAERLKAGGKTSLAWLAALPYSSGAPLLVVAVRHFFRLEVGKNSALSQMLTFSQLDNLTEGQQRGLRQLHDALTQNGQALQDIGKTVEALSALTKDTNQRVRELQDQVTKLVEHLHLANREVRARDSMSIRNESERLLVKRLLEAFRRLPDEGQRQHPQLLNNLGKLLVATGEFRQAQDEFKKAAAAAPEAGARAEAHYNAYRAALERKDWPGALDQLIEALRIDAKRFAPFPVGKYMPQRVIGAGGFGVVFLCKHKHMETPVVVKALLLDDLDREVDNVFSEAKVLSQLNGPAFVRMWDCGYADSANKSRPYLVMDYFDGLPLDEHVNRHGILSLADLKAIMVPIAQALQAAHEKGILHRDIKPANILVRNIDEVWHVKLIDFGLAVKQSSLENTIRSPGPADRTLAAGSIAGTLDYAAPEQLGKLLGVSVSARSDVYGFGKTCYFALLRTPDPDEQLKKGLPKGWKNFLANCTAQPENRLPDFTAVLQKLKGLKAPAEPAGHATKKPAGKRPALQPEKAPPRSPQSIPQAPGQPPTTQLTCPHCRQPLAVPAGAGGKSFQCPRCAGSFTVPAVKRERGEGESHDSAPGITFFRPGFRKNPSEPAPTTSNEELIVFPPAPSGSPAKAGGESRSSPAARHEVPTLPIRVVCPHCRGPATVAREHAGHVVQCPQCRRQFTAPAAPVPWDE